MRCEPRTFTKVRGRRADFRGFLKKSPLGQTPRGVARYQQVPVRTALESAAKWWVARPEIRPSAPSGGQDGLKETDEATQIRRAGRAYSIPDPKSSPIHLGTYNKPLKSDAARRPGPSSETTGSVLPRGSSAGKAEPEGTQPNESGFAGPMGWVDAPISGV
jgi:hypothetical protein